MYLHFYIVSTFFVVGAFSSSSPFPFLPLSVPSSWPAPNGGTGFHFGDIRAVISVPAGTAPNTAVTAQIYWRRRDNDPQVKPVLATSSDGSTQVPILSVSTLESDCGVVSFSATQGAGTYYVYYLPFTETGNDAWLHFHWLNCTNQTDRTCVLGSSDSQDFSSSQCSTVNPAQAGLVTGLETRDAFQGYNITEFTATQMEIAALPASYPQPNAPFLVYTDTAFTPTRLMNKVPAVWVFRDNQQLGPPNTYTNTQVQLGHYFVFQIVVYSYQYDLSGVTLEFSALSCSNGNSIPASSFRSVNMGGTGSDGLPFVNTINVTQGMIQPLYVGVDIPNEMSDAGTYTGMITVTAASPSGLAPVPVSISLTLVGPPATDNGYGDVYSLSRIRWLDSTLGSEDMVPAPFIPVGMSINGAGNTVNVTCLNKNVVLGANGLPNSITITTPKVRKGVTVTSIMKNVLASPMTFTLYDTTNTALQPIVTTPTTITSFLNASVSWASMSSISSVTGGGAAAINVTGNLGFDSYLEYVVTISSTGASNLNLGDVQLSYLLAPEMQAYVVGMDLEGSVWPGSPPTKDDGSSAWTWRWSASTASNKLWTGRIDAGLLLDLLGDGPDWDSPMFNKDFPQIPFVPPTWGGAAAAPTNNPYGVNASTDGTILAFSGPRSMPPGSSISFKFNLILTPSKNLDMNEHWTHRSVQVGYGTNYMTPQEVKSQGATIVTLHQGIPGIINGSLVNPFINWPFEPNLVVPFLTNYTQQSNALGMRTKFYYTVRELSNHAAELYVLVALQNEILLQLGSSYVIPQPGYCQDWDCHGGAAWLHEHVVENYTSCWQQGLSDGEFDAAVCDIGNSRWFNYYTEGAAWSVGHAPFMNGIYNDGISFGRRSMQRVRRASDAAVATSPEKLRPHFDLHTGHDPCPPVTSYATHFPFMDQVWNGEGFDFTKGPSYWLVEVSSQLHGLSGDRLGGSPPSDDFKGMLFGMSERNSATAPYLWSLWDDAKLNETTEVGFWEDDAMVTLTYTCTGAQPPYHTSILATTFTAYGSHALITIGSFCPTDESVTLNLDWDALGLNASTTIVSAPVVGGGVQPNGQVFPNATGPFHIVSGNGLFLFLEAQ